MNTEARESDPLLDKVFTSDSCNTVAQLLVFASLCRRLYPPLFAEQQKARSETEPDSPIILKLVMDVNTARRLTVILQLIAVN